jgi:hypothetical protein
LAPPPPSSTSEAQPNPSGSGPSSKEDVLTEPDATDAKSDEKEEPYVVKAIPKVALPTPSGTDATINGQQGFTESAANESVEENGSENATEPHVEASNGTDSSQDNKTEPEIPSFR